MCKGTKYGAAKFWTAQKKSAFLRIYVVEHVLRGGDCYKVYASSLYSTGYTTLTGALRNRLWSTHI